MLAALLLKPQPKRVMVIGLGGGHLSRVMSRVYPETVVDSVEIDKQVVKLAKQYFLYEESPNCKTHVIDGRIFIQNQIGKATYDIVWLDAFKSGSVPFHLKTQQFYDEIREVLKPDGVVSSNLYGQSNKLKPHDWETFLNVFRNGYGFEDSRRIATAILATDREPQWMTEDFLISARKIERKFPESMEEIAAMYKPGLLRNDLGFVFNDDFTELCFDQTIKKNNLDGDQVRPYSIVSIHSEDERN